MSEKVDWTEHEAKGNFKRPNLVAYCLIESMSAKTDSGVNIGEVFKPFNPKDLSVELKVNGVEVSLVEALGNIQNHIDNLEEEIRKTLRQEIVTLLHIRLEDIMEGGQ